MKTAKSPNSQAPKLSHTGLLLGLLALVPTALSLDGLLPMPAIAQISSDGTLSTTVTTNGNNFTINGGERAGGNLFHSFSEFGVPTGGAAFFNNDLDVENIFSRVTGGNISNIDGLIRANGSANLFLLNPAGIVFGPNAILNIGGSFLGSSASSLMFPGGTEFSATDTQSTPLLTINAPIGLWFRGNEGNIVSRLDNNGESLLFLQVQPGRSLGLVGGDVSLDGGIITTLGGRIELGGLAAAGTVGLNDDGSLSFPNGVARGNVSFSNGAIVNVSAAGVSEDIAVVGGNIAVNAHNIDISGESIIASGIGGGVGSPDERAGDITLNATGAIAINQSQVLNAVNTNGISDAGNIIITAESLSLTNLARLNASTIGQGNGGDINVDVTDSVLVSGASILATQSEGGGNSGNITINAGNTVFFEGTGDLAFGSNGITATNTLAAGSGKGGNITIATGSLFLSNGAQLVSGTFGIGNGGDIQVDARDSVFVSSGSRFITQSSGKGDAGNITINADNTVLFDGILIDENGAPRRSADGVLISSAASSGVLAAEAPELGLSLVDTGKGGDITIDTGSLFVTNGALLNTSTLGQGDAAEAGNIIIRADNLVRFDGIGTGAFSTTGSTATTRQVGNIILPFEVTADGGDIDIHTRTLALTGGATVTTETVGAGNAGDIRVNATDSVTISGVAPIIFELAPIQVDDSEMIAGGFSSGLFANTEENSSGLGGTIEVTTGTLRLSDGGVLSSRSRSLSSAGNVIVNVQDLELTGGSQIATAALSSGAAGSITVNATGGNVTISGSDPSFQERFERLDEAFKNGQTNTEAELSLTQIGPASGLFAQSIDTRGTGSGNINITAEFLDIADGGQVTVSNAGTRTGGIIENEEAGNLVVNVSKIRLNNGTLSAETASGNRGNITLNASEDIQLRNSSAINTNATGTATGGNIFIDTDFVIAFPGNSDITANAIQGDGGRISITADEILGIEQRGELTPENDITVTSTFGSSGEVIFNIPDVGALQGTENLSENAVEPEEAVTQACRPNSEDESSFTVIGRGGVPRGPQDPLVSDTMRVGGELSSQAAPTKPPIATLVEDTEPIYSEEIEVARGWIVHEDGVVELTAYPTPYTGDRPFPHPVRCPGKK